MIKEALRDAMLSIRENLSNDIIKLAQEKIIEQIKHDINFKKAKVVGIYYPILGEIDILELLRLYPKKRFALPKLYYNHIRYYEYDELTELVENAYGIKEPKHKIEVTQEVDYVLVPCVAVSPTNHRIGYGKGYFDRFFIKNPGKIKVGVAYCFQEIEFEELGYDVALDYHFVG